MNVKDINKEIEIISLVKLNGGLTLNKDLDYADLSTGFMVSSKYYEFKIHLNDINVFKLLKELASKLDTLDYVNSDKGRRKILKRENRFLGLWLDNGILYIDVSYKIKDKLVALELARLNEQLAIFDNSTKQVINVPTNKNRFNTETFKSM